MSSKKHILVVTIPGYGHIIPMLELAKKISAFHDVTFALSASKVPDLTTREVLSPNDRVEIYPIPDGLTIDPNEDTINDKEAGRRWLMAIHSSFAQLINGLPTPTAVGTISGLKPVNVIIVDIFFGVPVVTTIPYYIFNAANSMVLQCILALHDDTPVVAEGDEATARFMRIREPGGPELAVQAFEKVMFLPIVKTMLRATGMIINSLRDIETSLPAVEADPNMKGLTVHCVGPLFPEETSTKDAKNFAVEEKVAKWLDGKDPESVVYVSFGSFATPTDEQVTVLGQALLELGKPFLWSLREKCHKFLPDGLKNELEGRDGLVLPWAPQKLILAHPSVAIFVSHCGWNSTLEGLGSGKPFVAWPMFADQLLNGQWIVKLGAGVLIPETGTKGVRIVPVEEIHTAINEVGGWKAAGESGAVSKYRQASRVWSDKLRDGWTHNGSSFHEFMDLIEFPNKSS
ncbi:putative UDP-glycosyltransferase 72B2 [Hypsibius exemplaris]|uniref:UDP-glycosyltransferase 72B2 n=1 Tax=Hypsibius exemplaris TaxID=2072580 RepID=A0A9X6NJM6_HYPEX|nr:putative UDP-glycosyltransferase 72B2 [Hypsibius exemplaris]